MRYLLASLVLVTACVQNDDDNDPVPNPEASITPRTGEWYYADVTEVSSTCGADDNGVSGGFVIDTATATSFHVIPGDGTDPFSCSITGASFDCPERAAHEEDLRPAVDALLTARATAEGTFSSATRGTGTQEAKVTCAGTACSSIGTFPCNYKVRFSIVAR